MDSLSRGFLGAEMATLVNTLRLHSENLKITTQTLSELKQELLTNSKNEIKLFERAKKNVINATKTTINSLTEMDLSLQAMAEVSTTDSQKGGRRPREKKHVSTGNKIVPEKKNVIPEAIPFFQSNDFNF